MMEKLEEGKLGNTSRSECGELGLANVDMGMGIRKGCRTNLHGLTSLNRFYHLASKYPTLHISHHRMTD